MFSNFVKKNFDDLTSVATAVRILGMDAVLAAKSGHVGLPLGGAEIGTLLYFVAMRHDPKNPHWVDRDRFVLSAGHGSMLQYALLHLAGYDLSIDDIKNFRQVGSRTPGHPEFGVTAGVECTTGPLGQGIANAVGMALAERMLAARFNDASNTPIDHRTYVLLGDGCMMEGVASEACSLAGHLKLNRLIAFYDANNITIDGTTDISFTENVGKRFEAYGWNVLHADGNDFVSLAAALDNAYANSQHPNNSTGPTLIVAKGVPGKGSPKWEGKHKVHGNPMSAEDVVEAKKHLGVSDVTPFAVPENLRSAARELIAGQESPSAAWQSKFKETQTLWQKNSPDKLKQWSLHFENAEQTTATAAAFWQNAHGKSSTRVSSGKALSALAKSDPRLVGGSADLAGSNNTTLSDSTFVSAADFSGRNIHFGVREHGMAAICNGMALHGGFVPYCATFTVFSDYMRPSIRLAALMSIPTHFILTHDSFAVGEDGPTHQPIEHAAALRAIPNLFVARPADTFETYAAWLHSQTTKVPSALLLTRQDVPDLDDMLTVKRTPDAVMDAMKTGAYLIKDYASHSAQKVTLIASGSEVSLALETAKILESKTFSTLEGEVVNLAVRVVSAPCPQLLTRNPVTLNRLVPGNVPTVAIEAGASQSWGEIVGRNGAIFALDRFGESGPHSALASHFGFTAENLAKFAAVFLNLR